MKFTDEHKSAISERLRGLPKIEKKKEASYSKQELVKGVMKEIRLAIANGYTIDQIAQLFTEEKIEMTVSTLKSGIKRAKKAKEIASKKKVSEKVQKSTD